MSEEIIKHNEQDFLNRLSELVELSKAKVVSQANSALTLLFWQIGKQINEFVLTNNRAEYGKHIMSTASTHLTEKYGNNFELRNLRRMRQFAEQFEDIEIVSTLSTQLHWSHLVELLPLKKLEAKLFYHRKLKRLVAIELKIGRFKAAYKGQMELYLKWLNKYEKQEEEHEPIGLILCTETSKEQIELLEMHKDGIMVAEYWTDLPPKSVLEQKLHQAVIEAKERLERRKLK